PLVACVDIRWVRITGYAQVGEGYTRREDKAEATRPCDRSRDELRAEERRTKTDAACSRGDLRREDGQLREKPCPHPSVGPDPERSIERDRHPWNLHPERACDTDIDERGFRRGSRRRRDGYARRRDVPWIARRRGRGHDGRKARLHGRARRRGG